MISLVLALKKMRYYQIKKQLNDFKKEYKELDGTIVFSSPQYKVYIGPFRSRLHAEGTLKRIKDKYPTSLLIKP